MQFIKSRSIVVNDQEYLTVEEVAEHLRLSPAKVRRLVAANEIGNSRFGKRILISVFDLQEYKHKCHSQSIAGNGPAPLSSAANANDCLQGSTQPKKTVRLPNGRLVKL